MNVAGCTVLALALPAVALFAQTPLEQAADAYLTAQTAEIELKEHPPPDRTRSEYLSIIRMYERVYLITPHTGYADDALFNIAALYELIDDSRNAARTLQFLVREYPASRFVSQAESDLERLTAPPATDATIETADDNGNRASAGPARPDRSVAVENIRYWESQKSVRIVVDLAGEPHVYSGRRPKSAARIRRHPRCTGGEFARAKVLSRRVCHASQRSRGTERCRHRQGRS